MVFAHKSINLPPVVTSVIFYQIAFPASVSNYYSCVNTAFPVGVSNYYSSVNTAFPVSVSNYYGCVNTAFPVSMFLTTTRLCML